MVTVNLNQWFSLADCRNTAKALNKVFSAYCTEFRKARPWL